MDGGPFRTSRPTDRRTAARPEPAYRPVDQPQVVEQQPSVSHAPVSRHSSPSHTASKQEKPFWKRALWPVIGILVTLGLAAGVVAWMSGMGGGIAIDGSKYQAVFFTNGQVYFGKLQNSGSGYMRLTDIYYLQSQQNSDEDSGNPQATSNDQSNVQLIKLGDEIHGPEDEMVISKDQVLFYENLKPDGKVAQSIQKFKEAK